MATETNQLRTILTLQDNMSAKLTAIEGRLKHLGMAGHNMGQMGMSAAEKWGMKMQMLGMNLKMVGQTMSMYVTAPLVGLGYVAVKTAMDMEAKWAEVRKVYDGTASDIKNLLEPAVNKLSVSLGFQRVQTMDALAAIAAMGYKGKPAIDMLTQSMKFARLGNMELEQSMEAVVAVSKIYNVSGKKLTAMLAVMNETENVSAASMEDLTWGIREAASVGRLAGVDIRELSAMMAVLRERAIPAGEAAFALKSIFTRLRNPTKDAKEILDKFNIAVSNTKGEVLDADQILLKIAGSWKKMTERERESLATELVGIHQKGRFISLIDDMTRKNSTYNQVLKKTADETTNVSHYQRELNIFLEQAKVKWEAIKTQLGIVAEKIGKDLLPVVLKFAQVAADLATKFGNLPAPIRRTSLVILGLAAIIGPILMVLGSLINSIGAIASIVPGAAKALIWLANATRLAAAAQWALNIAQKASPIMLIISGAIALSLILYKLTGYLERVLGPLGKLLSMSGLFGIVRAWKAWKKYDIGIIADQVAQQIGKAWNFISSSFRIGAQVAINYFLSLGNKIIINARNFFVDQLPILIGTGIGKVIIFFRGLPGRVAASLFNFYNVVKNHFTSAKNIAASIASNLVSSVVAWISKLPSRIAAYLARIPGEFNSVFQRAKDYVYQKVHAIPAIIKGIIGMVRRAASSVGAAMWNGLTGWLSKIRRAIANTFNLASPPASSAKAGGEAGVKSRQHGGLISGSQSQAVPIIAHGGERIISHTGADVAKGSSNININFNGGISIRKDSDITAIADAVAKALGRRATLASYGAF